MMNHQALNCCIFGRNKMIYFEIRGLETKQDVWEAMPEYFMNFFHVFSNKRCRNALDVQKDRLFVQRIEHVMAIVIC